MFSFSLDLSSIATTDLDIDELWREVDDYTSLVMAGCTVLDAAGAGFRMTGFGLSDWGMNVEYDMSVFLEQVPGLLSMLEVKGGGEILLYTQRIERALRFYREGESVRVECVSGTNWKPEPDVERLELLELLGMSRLLMNEFVEGLIRAGVEKLRIVPFLSTNWHSDAS